MIAATVCLALSAPIPFAVEPSTTNSSIRFARFNAIDFAVFRRLVEQLPDEAPSDHRFAEQRTPHGESVADQADGGDPPPYAVVAAILCAFLAWPMKLHLAFALTDRHLSETFIVSLVADSVTAYPCQSYQSISSAGHRWSSPTTSLKGIACAIFLAKVEYFNPSGSVKDRIGFTDNRDRQGVWECWGHRWHYRRAEFRQ